jgi:hypothetical protein
MTMRLFLISILFFAIGFLHAQEQQSVLKTKEITGLFSYFMPDEIGNLFALTTSGQLKKYNGNLDSMGCFNDVRRYGKLHSISASNPLRSLLFFKDYRIILVLDRMMQVVNKIDLRMAQIFQVQAIAQSYDNMIWVFDEQESKIKKINDEGKVLFESADLRLIFSESIIPSLIFDLGGYLYLYDEKNGLFIFDYYGALKNRIVLLGGIKDKQLLIYTPNSIDIKSISMPKEISAADYIRFGIKGCYVSTAEAISWYEWKNN